jgi:hypothetical protein
MENSDEDASRKLIISIQQNNIAANTSKELLEEGGAQPKPKLVAAS